MRAVDQKEEGLKEKRKGPKGAHNCLDCMEVFGRPRLSCAQLRRDDKLQEEEELVKKKAEEEVATLELLHPAELDARWPPRQIYSDNGFEKKSTKPVDPSRY